MAARADEGPLSNATFLATHEEATAALAEGDRLLAALRGGDGDAARRAGAFDAWQRALEISANGDAVPALPDPEDAAAAALLPDPDGTAGRRVEGVAHAVLRRLHALDPGAGAAWSARFGALAEDRLAAAVSAVGVERVERDLPATPAAVRAAIRRLDGALERGDAPAAATWLGRADRHVRLLARFGVTVDGAEAALARRRAALEALGGDAGGPEAWEVANDAGLVRVETLPAGRGAHLRAPIRPGFARLADGRVALQRARALVLFDPALGASLGGEIVVDEVLSGAGGLGALPARVYAGPGRTGWPLLPLAVGDDLVLVHGRTGQAAPNVLMRLEAPPTLEEPGAVPVPRLVWAVQGGLRVGPDGRVEEDPALAGLRGLEIQPGPVRDGPRVLVQARQWPLPPGDGGPAAARGLDRIALTATGEVRSFVLAFDLGTGALLWQRAVAQGVELGTDLGRLGGRALQSTCAQPPVRAGRMLFLGTHLGTGTLLDATDGRLAWTLRARRRDADAPGWVGGRPPTRGTAVAWAPSDGDHLYWLDASGDPGRPPLAYPPRAIGEAEALVDTDGRDALVLARAGSRPALSTWEGPSGRRRDALHLGPGDPTPAALASADRAWVATPSGLHLFDRTRDNLLLAVAPFEDRPEDVASLWATGDRIFAVGAPESAGRQRVWVFAARP